MTETYSSGIDPRTKLVYALCMSLLAVVLNRPAFLFPLFCAAAAIAVADGGAESLLLFTKRLKWMGYFFALIAVLQSLFNPSGGTLLKLGGLTILTGGGLASGLSFILRMAVITLSAYVVSRIGRRPAIEGLIKWKMPYEIAFMTSVALYFIPVFGEEFKNSLNALQLRGVDLKRVPFHRKIATYTSLVMPVISGMLIRAREMAAAMEMRAFRAYDDRTSYLELRLGFLDYVLMGASAAVTIGILAVYFFAGGAK
jgi:energy-coupling factor transport system permease protein